MTGPGDCVTLHICIKRAALSAPSASMATHVAAVIGNDPNGWPSIANKTGLHAGTKFGTQFQKESLSAMALITLRTS